MKRKVEATWAITRVHHERNRYIFNMHYKERKISKELLEYLFKEGYADRVLIAKWRKVCEHSTKHTHTKSARTPHKATAHKQQGAAGLPHQRRLCGPRPHRQVAQGLFSTRKHTDKRAYANKKPTKQQGYERLCCMQCIQRSGSSGSTCICRVPKASLPEGKVVECVNCGCHGCASGD